MSHYWTDTDHIETRRAQIADWLEDVEEFGPAIVAEACREWRRTPNSRRPLPGDIRALCVARQAEYQERARFTAPTDMDEYARSVGFANNAGRMEAIRAAKRDIAVDGERLRQIDRELTARRAEVVGHTAKALGVTAREVTEDLRRGRLELGLEPDPIPPAQAAE